MRINTHTLKVKVTDEHIKNGTPDSCTKCAMALAVQSAIDKDGAPWQCYVEMNQKLLEASIILKIWAGKTWDNEVTKSSFVVKREHQTRINKFVQEFDRFFVTRGTGESTRTRNGFIPINCKPFEFELEVTT